MAKYLDSNGLLYFWSKIKAIVPTRTSELTNDSDFVTSKDIPEGATASTTTPKMDGSATAGTELAFARGDHVHPSDTAKADKATTLAGYGITDAYTKTQVDGLVSGAFHYKGSKDNYSDLPTSGNVTGDVWNIVNADAEHGVKAGDNVAWNGSDWDVLSGMVDLSDYLKVTDMVAITNSEIDAIVS